QAARSRHAGLRNRNLFRRTRQRTCCIPRMSRFLLIFVWAGALYAQVSVEVEGRYWFSQINSRIRVERNGFGTDIDAGKDLGFTDSNFPRGARRFIGATTDSALNTRPSTFPVTGR